MVVMFLKVNSSIPWKEEIGQVRLWNEKPKEEVTNTKHKYSI
jgi:hypothetical protein